MVGGWFVGNFEPSILKTQDFEVALKKYKQGDTETFHVHKIATEITVIVEGTVFMCGQKWESGSVILLSPGEGTNFEAISDATTLVVKTPSVMGDKYH